MDMARNSRALSQTVFECSGQRYDPDDPRLHTACSQTWHNRLCAVDSKKLEGALLGLVRYLIRGKWFDEARVCGCLAVAVDGTLQEKIRSATLSEKEKCRFALEARIVTPWGWNIPVLFEPVEPYEGEKEKQDCEMAAFKRLAKGKRKVTQEGWAKLLFAAILTVGFYAIGGFEVAVPVRRMSREHLR